MYWSKDIDLKKSFDVAETVLISPTNTINQPRKKQFVFANTNPHHFHPRPEISWP